MTDQIDIAMAIEHIYYAAQYYGSLTANTKEAYDNLNWLDERPKPSWQDILGAWAEMQLPDIPALSAEAREKRDALLRSIYDPGIMMALRALRTTDPSDTATLAYVNGKIGELDAFATQLQGIPDQVGFPLEITWPENPTP